ncbi:DUF2752 domain-containing protein [Limisphaera sp. VF-2]|jgi:hypothetical protein|uniref:DUF2752 domain-containing protein n=1 Tax=Limisphaera sp. VF-2 TaxID=3400418 RepID=UPI003097FD12
MDQPTCPPRLDRPARWRPVWFLMVLMLGAGLWVLWHFDPARSALYPPCRFHAVTGWQCPGCGGLRAVHALLHGRIAESWQFNPLPILLALAGPVMLAAWWRWRRRHPGQAWTLSPLWAWAGLGGLLLFGILRNVF